MPKATRVLLLLGVSLGVFTVAVVAFLFLFGRQAFFAIETWQEARKIPIMKSTPRDLTDLAVADSKGQQLSFDGAEFEIPWSVDRNRSHVIGNGAVIALDSGNAISLFVGPPDGFAQNLLSENKIQPDFLTRLYGDGVLRSDYTLMSAIYRTTPADITPFTPANRAAGLASVLLIKAVEPPTTDWAIYNIRSKDFRGFQLGEPSRRPKEMCLQLYGQDVEFEFALGQKVSGPTPAITQADLNRIIQTVHKAPQARPTLIVSAD